MKRLTTKALTVSLFFLLGGLTLTAQEQRAKPTPKKLAIEVVLPGGAIDHQVPVGGRRGMRAPQRRLPGWEQPAAGEPPLTGIEFTSAYEGDAVRIKVSVVFDDSQMDAPGPKYGPKERSIATYLAREGETVNVGELARFGVEPMQVKVVRANPEPETPPLSSAPQIVNETKSVEVVSFERDQRPTSRNHYNLRLRNATRKNIIALGLYEASPGGPARTRMIGYPGRPLIRAGDFYDYNYYFNVAAHTTPHQGVVPDADQPRTLNVGTVVFDDGTYEGDVGTAASVVAYQQGVRTQNERVALLLQIFLDAPALGAPAAIEKLKAEVSALRIDADPAAVAELRAQFPALAESDADKRLAADVMSGLRGGKDGVTHRIKRWEEMRAREPETFDLRRHLSALKDDLERSNAHR